jgi:hypothetical protein
MSFPNQQFFDAIAKAAQMERTNYHLTLGALIEGLGALANKDQAIRFADGKYPADFDSYRGYYSDLMISADDEKATVQGVLARAQACVGKTFQGYKGGDFTMDVRTPLWRDEYGHCANEAITGLVETADGIVLVTKTID